MASTIGPSPPSDHLSLESIPTVDLRLLSQSELTALSLCSTHAFDLRRCDDVVIPKIDRSVFNESAGSRKQTYSRLRLAPRNAANGGPTTATVKPRTGGNSAASPALTPIDNDNSRIISLFKALFNGENVPERKDGNGGDCKGGYDDNDASALVPVNVEYSESFLGEGGGGDRKRKRGRKPRSGGSSGDTALAVTSITMVTTTTEIVAAAPTKEDEAAREEEEEKRKEEREKELVNRSGEVVDLRELGRKEDPYGEELRRRTDGRESSEELLGFITDLDGVWGSRRKKRKIVDANQFGDVLPVGWKVLIAMKKKQGRAWVFVRRYISPNGRYFVSCKEVSSYLLSLTSPEDLKQQMAFQCPEDPVVENKFPSENATDLGTKNEFPSSCVTPQSNDHKALQMPLSTSTSQSMDHEKQLVLFTNVHSGTASALKCHKCSTAFHEKDELLNHLVSCHKRKRRKSGAPIEDDIIMKDGKYECQFCNKVFLERSSYFGHVGIHVKNYVKSIGGTPSLTVTSKQSSSAVAVSEAPMSISVAENAASVSADEVPVSVSVDEIPVSVSVDKVPVTVSVDKVPVTVSENVGDKEMNVVPITSAPEIPSSGELNLNSADGKPEADWEAETHLGHDKFNNNNMSRHVESISEAVHSNKVIADVSSGKNDETVYTTDNKARELEEAAVISAMKPDSCSGSEEVYNNDNNNLCETLGQVNAAECAGSEISKSSAELVENDEICFLPDIKTVDIGNDDHFAIDLLQRERVASESDLFAENKENSSVDQNSEIRSLGNNTVKNSFTEGVEVEEEEELMDHSGSDQVDLGIDLEDDVQDSGSLDGCSAVLHKEEEAHDTTANRIEFLKSPLVVSYENSSPSTDRPTTVMENYIGKELFGMVSETEVNMCSLDDSEAAVDADRCIAEERPESCAAVLSKANGCDYIANEAETVPHIEMLTPREAGAFQVEQSCTLEKLPRELSSSRKGEEPNSDQAINSSNLFFTSGSNDAHIAANVASNHVQSHSDVSNVLGAFNNFFEDKQEQIPKNILSGLTINEHLHEVAMNNMTDVPSTTTAMQLPDLDKVDCSRTNKMMFDFGNITEMNARFLSSVQNESVPEETSPFSLWGQQACTIEDNQSRVYDGASGVSQQERASNNNPLNLVGLQQPSDVRYNLNEVCMNEQRYGVQNNEAGVYRENNDVRRQASYGGSRGIAQHERTSDNNSLIVGLQQPSHAGFNLNKVHMNEQRYGVQLSESGVYSKSNDSRREGISHGNTLNLAGFQQQCDAGYNLNKPFINQQSYGMPCNETGAYSTSDESKQERVTYGNSLSLASVPQTCDTRYSLNKPCIQQTCDSGFSLNKGYMGTMQGLTKLDELGRSQDQDLMLGFRNSNGRPNQGVATEYLWRPAEGSMLPGGLMDSSSSQGQSSSTYQAFDFLSDKGGNDLYAANEKFDNLSSFEGLRSNSVEPMEFSFMTTQDSNAQLGHQKALGFNTQMDQGFGSSVWHQKPSLPNMMAGVVSTICVWCGSEFHQDSLGCEMQAGSIGYLCPNCKARISGQYL